MTKSEYSEEKKCLFCNEPFKPKAVKQVFCSSNCRSSHWRINNPENDKKIRTRYETKYIEEEKKINRQDPRYAHRQKKSRARAARRLNDVRDLIREYKTKVGCQRCGFNEHYSALQFHHQPGFIKKFNVSNSKTVTQFYSEAKKCIVLCANCHAVQSHKDLVEKAKRKKKEA